MIVKSLVREIYSIENFFSKEECNRFIQRSESIGYKEATINTERGSQLVKHVRNNERVLITDDELAKDLWQRLSEFAPAKIGKSIAVGLNELFRFYRYKPGQKFNRHLDESFIRNESEASYYTFMIYLNEEYTGGETVFDNITIEGKQGMGLIFLHSLPHEGAEVLKGTKYVLRTDIMYRLA